MNDNKIITQKSSSGMTESYDNSDGKESTSHKLNADETLMNKASVGITESYDDMDGSESSSDQILSTRIKAHKATGRIVTIDLLRGVSIFLMLNIHILSSGDIEQGPILEPIIFILEILSQFNILFWFCSAFGAGLSAISKIKKNDDKVSPMVFLMVLARLLISLIIFLFGTYFISVKGAKLIWLALGNTSSELEKQWHWSFNLLRLITTNSNMVIRDILISTTISVLTLLLLLYYNLSRFTIIVSLMSSVLLNYALGYLIPHLASLATFEESSFQPWYSESTPKYEWPAEFIPSASNYNKNNCFYLYPDIETGKLELAEEYCAQWSAGNDVKECLELVGNAASQIKPKDIDREPDSFALMPDSAYPIRVCNGWTNRDGLNCDAMSYDLLYLEGLNNGEDFRYDEHAPSYGFQRFPCTKPPDFDGVYMVEVAKVDNWLVPSQKEKITTVIKYWMLFGMGTSWQKFVQWLFKSIYGGYGVLSYGMASNTGVLLAYCISEYGWTGNILSCMFYSGIILICLGLPEVIFYAKTGIISSNHPGNLAMALGVIMILYSFLAYLVELRQTGMFQASKIRESSLYRYFNRFGSISFTLYTCQYAFGWPIEIAMMGLASYQEGYCLTDQFSHNYMSNRESVLPPNVHCDNRLHSTKVWFFLLYMLIYNIFISFVLYLWERSGYKGSLEWIILKVFGLFYPGQTSVRFQKQLPDVEHVESEEETTIEPIRNIGTNFQQVFTAFPTLLIKLCRKFSGKS